MCGRRPPPCVSAVRACMAMCGTAGSRSAAHACVTAAHASAVRARGHVAWWGCRLSPRNGSAHACGPPAEVHHLRKPWKLVTLPVKQLELLEHYGTPRPRTWLQACGLRGTERTCMRSSSRGKPHARSAGCARAAAASHWRLCITPCAPSCLGALASGRRGTSEDGGEESPSQPCIWDG
jgi:hypothetical protein